ncbi:hypothetical protein, conserved [Eimeria brunetti]|uniref:Uncharacterized protein n=1 Tax=Eimeria brunetti TaxID=51314 RepID=U6LF77_9EIME|nr:hypothetical protein, conserved [Eimeria brunetti]
MKIINDSLNGLPALLSASFFSFFFFFFSDFPLFSLSVRVGVSLSPAAYDFNQALSPAGDSGWETVGDAAFASSAPFSPSFPFSENSMAEVKASAGENAGEKEEKTAEFKSVALHWREGGASPSFVAQEETPEENIITDNNNSNIINNDDNSINNRAGGVQDGSEGNFLQMNRLREWWKRQKEARARKRAERKAKEMEKELERKRKREEKKQRGISVSESESSDEEARWYGSGSESLLGEGAEEGSLGGGEGPSQ